MTPTSMALNMDSKILENITFDKPNSLWKSKEIEVKNCTMLKSCCAPLWYVTNIVLFNCKVYSSKAIRNSSNLKISYSEFNGDEAFYKTRETEIANCRINGSYNFFNSSKINAKNLGIQGKNVFKGAQNVQIEDSTITSDYSFNNCKNIILRNCIIVGNNFANNSENVKLIDCKIEGNKPLSYSKNVNLVNCTMENCEECFEQSEVNGFIVGKVKSIKNPIKGNLFVEECEEYIKDENDKSEGGFILNSVK